LPELLPPGGIEALSENAAVLLFVERAQAVDPGFALAESNIVTIADICRQLDGLPLAIELAAARSKMLPPAALLERLDRRLPLLVGGARDAPLRQQTLQATIAWSYDLLSPAEQSLFRRLAVFRGGGSLEAAEFVASRGGAVAGREERELLPSIRPAVPSDILDGIASLIDKSLVRQEETAEGEPRIFLLETIAEFGLDRLAESGEAEETFTAHTDYFLALAEQARAKLMGPEFHRWMSWLEREHDNFRSALQWLWERRDVEQGLRLGRALSRFWFLGSHLTEGRAHLEAFLSLSEASAATIERARALHALGQLVYRQGDYAAARTAFQESLVIARAGDDLRGTAAALRELGRVAMDQGDYAAACPLLEESLAVQRTLGDSYGIAWSVVYLGQLAFFTNDQSSAEAALNEALELFRGLRDAWGIGTSFFFLGRVAGVKGDYRTAQTLLVESLNAIAVQLPWAVSFVLEEFALLATAQGQWRRAVRLAGAAAEVRDTIGSPLAPAWAADAENRLAPARRSLAEAEAEAAWAEGRAMSMKQAVAEALAAPEPERIRAEEVESPVDRNLYPLTPREREVAILLARGLTNRQIGAELFITEGTAALHVKHLLSKLGMASRAQVAAWAVMQGLAGGPDASSQHGEQ
jgi:predicted ATPase/DNA-binding CsgD family transcriptional regulator